MRPNATGRVVSVVLNYMHPDDTLRCVESLSLVEYRNHRIIVVDNGSGEEVVASLVHALDPTVDRILLDENLGYGAGNNVGIRAAVDAGAEFAWVVNPDVVVEPAALGILVRAACLHPDAGILGSRILHGGSEPSRVWFDGGIIDWDAAGATTHLHMGALESEQESFGPYDVDYVTGAGMLLRSRMLADVGLIPEDWFLYFEETAFNVHARRRGWRTMVDPRSRLHHFKRSTGRLPQPYYVYYFVRNRYRFGIEVADASPDEVRDDVASFVDAWRARVRDYRPDWLPVYDRLVTEATQDGISLRRGYRDLAELQTLTA
jgi:GT2 family glycosyltransferase